MTTTVSHNRLSSKEEIGLEVLKEVFFEFIGKPVWVASDLSNMKDKKPINIKTDYGASCNDESTWATFAEVEAYIQDKPHMLPAIALSPGIGLAIIDLDHVLEASTGRIHNWAEEIVNNLCSYTEISASGEGLHIVVKGKKPGEDCKKGLIEVYDQKKFITLTGNNFRGPGSIESRQEALDQFYYENFPAQTDTPKEITQKSPPLTDEEVLTLCRKAKNKDKFYMLFEGKHQENNSEADLALIAVLAFYTQDKEQLDRLFRQSKLYRDKWEKRADYRERTIEKALEGIKETYQPHRGEQKQGSIADSWDNPRPIGEDDNLEMQFPLDALPEVLNSAVKEVSRALRVDPALPSLPGLGMTALQIGKKALVKEKEGLYHHASQFLCGVAESGERKSSVYELILEGVKRALDLELEEYEKKKTEVRAHNDLIKEEAAHIKAEVRGNKLDREKAGEVLAKLYATQKPMPPEPFNFGDDLTSERLFQKIAEHKGTYGVFSSDARGIFAKILGKGTKDGSSGESIYLGGMWGDDISRSRVGSNKGMEGGEDLRVRKPALTTVALIQPDIWSEMAKDKRMRQSGMISRISLVIPTSQMGTRIESEKDEEFNPKRVEPFTTAILRIRKWNPDKPVIVNLSQEAQGYRREFYNIIEKELQAGGKFEDVKDIATKATSLAARYALSFAILDLASLGDLPTTIPPISAEQWLRAQMLQSYFLSQAVDSQRTHSRTGNIHILHKVCVWLTKQVQSNETVFVLPSQIAKGVRGAQTEDLEANIIPRLIEEGWLRHAENARRGKVKYEVNPKINPNMESR
jgi:hypothetical protein